MTSSKDKIIRDSVKERYGEIARHDQGENQPQSSCCGGNTIDAFDLILPKIQSSLMGYSDEELASVPDGANLGLGCGNPQAIAALKPGEVVLDLGSGAGFDSFLAARQIGNEGKVIGIDMTPDMIKKARENAEKGSYSNVEFRQGEIEKLPVEDSSIDVILSNCVINLSPDKPAVFKEAYRVLKPGGRLAISDMVASAVMPAEIREDLNLHSACVSGALLVEDLNQILVEAGYKNIQINPKDESREFIKKWTPGIPIEDFVLSATIEATK
ncbi:MAG: arsenite methyltransferase [Anaerolineales bacterium]|nr:arsenite methyltransferase [Anaerolineales bacterium]